MKKKQKSSKVSGKRLFILIGAVIAVLLIGFQALFDVYVYRLVRDQESVRIQRMIVDATDALLVNAATDPQTANVYMPEARLYLPPASNTYPTVIKYSYEPAFEDTEEIINVTSRASMASGRAAVLNPLSLEETFNNVPKLQACTRQFVLKYSDKMDYYEDYTVVSTKTLNNGRTLYVMQASKCPDFADEMKMYLEQIQSY